MNKTLISICILILSINIIAQKFSGKVIFSIEYDLPEAMESQRSMFPTEMITYIDKEASRIEQKTMMGDQIVITKTKANKSTLLMNMMGQKMAIEIINDESADLNPKIDYIDETKMIAGYNCYKAIYHVPNEEQDNTVSIEIFYTPKISSEANQQFKGLKGLPLEYSIEAQGMTMHFSANSINEEKLPKSIFEIPKDYEKIAYDEFQKMMGQ